jgi:hypothetical protein
MLNEPCRDAEQVPLVDTSHPLDVNEVALVLASHRVRRQNARQNTTEVVLPYLLTDWTKFVRLPSALP